MSENSARRFYDLLGAEYDAVIDWPGRLEREGPFYRGVFERHQVRTVLDVACGSGHHAALFASWGLEVTACDPSEAMLGAARAQFGDRGIEWLNAEMGRITAQVGRRFDAITCLGNSYPHLLSEKEAQGALDDFAQSLREGGALIIQTLNYAQMMASNQRFAGPAVLGEGQHERFLVRLWDLGRREAMFHLLRLARGEQGWEMQVASTPQRPTFRADLERQLEAGGFGRVEFYGAFDGSAYEETQSGQLVAVALKGT